MAVTFNFNAPNGTLLKDYTENGYGFSDVATWEIIDGAVGNDLVSAPDGLIQLVGASFSDGANVEFDITFKRGTVGYTGILIADATAENGYLVRCDSAASEIEVWSVIAGAYAIRIQKTFAPSTVPVHVSVVSGTLVISSSEFTNGSYVLPAGCQETNIFFRETLAGSNTYIDSMTLPIPFLGAVGIVSISSDNSVQRGETAAIQLTGYADVVSITSADIDGTPLTNLSWDGVTGILTGDVSASQGLTTTGVLTVNGTESS